MLLQSFKELLPINSGKTNESINSISEYKKLISTPLSQFQEAVSRDIEASKSEYEQVLKFFNGKINFRLMDECWKEVFHLNFESITSMTPEQADEKRQAHIKKYSYENSVSVKSLTDKILAQYPSGFIDKEDVYMEGVLALTQGINRLYSSPSVWKERLSEKDKSLRIGPTFLKGGNLIANNKEDGFLAKTVKGAIYDALRDNDRLTPHARQMVNKVKDCIEKFEQANKRKPTPAEIAKELNSQEPVIKQYLNLISLNDTSYDDDIDTYRHGDTNVPVSTGYRMSPEIRAILEKNLDEAAKVIAKNLEGTTRFVVELYIFEGLEKNEIKSLLGVSNVEELFEEGIEKIKYELKDVKWSNL